MPEAFIVSAVRTPIGRFLGSLKGIPAPKLGAAVVREAVARAAVDPERVEDVIMGCVLPAGLGQNPARQSAIWGGIPSAAGAMTINKVCGSGLKAVALAAQAIRAGDHDVVVAGGMENMSRVPYLAPDAREGSRLGHGKFLDSMIQDGLWDVYNDFHMGITGEKVAEKYGISREEQDVYAAESHHKAAAAQASTISRWSSGWVEMIQMSGPTSASICPQSWKRASTPKRCPKASSFSRPRLTPATSWQRSTAPTASA